MSSSLDCRPAPKKLATIAVSPYEESNLDILYRPHISLFYSKSLLTTITHLHSNIRQTVTLQPQTTMPSAVEEAIRNTSFSLWSALDVPAYGYSGVRWIESVLPFPFFNRIALIQEQADLFETVQQVMRFFRKKGTHFSLFSLRELLSNPIKELLACEKMLYTTSMKGMVLDCNEIIAPEPTQGVHVEPLYMEHDTAAWQKILEEGTDFPKSAAHLYIELHKQRASSSFLHFLSHENGYAVACACIHIHNKIATVYTVATLPEARRRGIASNIVYRALGEAKHRGCTHAVLLATTQGTNMYQRLGFCSFNTVDIYFSS